MLWRGWRGGSLLYEQKASILLASFLKGLISRYFFQKESSIIHYGSFLPYVLGEADVSFWFSLILLHSSVTQSFSRRQISRFLFKSLLYRPLSLFASILWRGGQLGLGLFPCRILHCPHWFLAGGIDSIYLLKSLLCHPSLFSQLYFWGDWVPYFFQNTILASFDGGGFAYFIALLPYPLWFPLWGVAVSINSQTLLYHPSLPYHIILWRGAQLGLFPPQMLFYPHSFPLSSLTLLHFSLKVMISIYFFKSSL